mmetsp:Transcript_64050/g.134647  ORF Transcript_64050/g.134647 Transcript_64050/m.134647 type:complete len:446 (-) Transcript_64050:185-1522(-)
MTQTSVAQQASPISSKGLKKSLGLPVWLVDQLVVSGTPFRRLCEFLSGLFEPFEEFVFRKFIQIPAGVKHTVMTVCFKAIMAFLKLLPESWWRRGISPTLSPEVHAITVMMWPMRLIPITMPRVRVGLTSLSFSYPASSSLVEEQIDMPERGVRGIWLRTAPPTVKAPPVFVWFFGGAFFGGSATDSKGFVEKYARQLGCDAFLIDYRICPEFTIDDAYVDGCRAYEWVLTRTQPERVVFASCSSGGGVAARVLQLCAAGEDVRKKYFFGKEQPQQPAGHVSIGAFVNYTPGETVDPGNSLRAHRHMDLLVTERLYEFVQPKLIAACGNKGEEGKRVASPLFQDCGNLCPHFLSFASHEACVDDNRAFVDKLRASGVAVTPSERPFLWHAYPLFACFVPEGREEMERIVTWVSQLNDHFKLAFKAAEATAAATATGAQLTKTKLQ